MEWWGWLTWGITAATAAGALILGIRAERRATRYTALWVRDIGSGVLRFTNRTGEDAADLEVQITGAKTLTPTKFTRVPADATIAVSIRPEGRITVGEKFGVRWRLIWTRPQTGKRYVASTSANGRRLHGSRQQTTPAGPEHP